MSLREAGEGVVLDLKRTKISTKMFYDVSRRRHCARVHWPVIGPDDSLGSPDWGIVRVVRQLPRQLPDLLPVAGQLLRRGVCAPWAREERTLELKETNETDPG